MTEKFCFELFNKSGRYLLHACPLVGQELSTDEMNAIDSLFGQPPNEGNNDEDWFLVNEKKDVVNNNYEIRDKKGRAKALIVSDEIDLTAIAPEKKKTLLRAFGAASIAKSKWDIEPVEY